MCVDVVETAVGYPRGINMEPLMLLGMLIGIILVVYAAVNIVFKLVVGALAFLQENRLTIIVVAVILIGLWFGLHA